jgi:hypothetical protein
METAINVVVASAVPHQTKKKASLPNPGNYADQHAKRHAVDSAHRVSLPQTRTMSTGRTSRVTAPAS